MSPAVTENTPAQDSAAPRRKDADVFKMSRFQLIRELLRVRDHLRRHATGAATDNDLVCLLPERAQTS